MESDRSTVWKSASLAKKYLEGVREAIPLADEQLNVMLRLIEARGHGIESFLDLGCGDGVLSAAIFRRYPQALSHYLSERPSIFQFKNDPEAGLGG